MTRNLTAPDGAPATSFCFGTMQFGGKADAAASQEMYEACRAAGINFFDTAYSYTEGQSETLLGQYARPERDRLIIATKCGHPDGVAPATIRVEFDESRRRLGMDMVDILYLHRWDDATPLSASFETLADLRAAGLIRHVGVSNYAAWQVMKAIAAAREFDLDIAIIQPMYNLVKRQAEVELLPMARAEDLSVATYSPLGGGLLTGKYGAGDTAGRLVHDQMYAARYGPDWMHAAAAGLSAIAAELGTDPATLAVAWVARHPGVTQPIISARSAAQLAPSLDALSFEMDNALYARLSLLAPTPPPATDRLEEA